MNIGLFGGSFDPIHKGHIALAQAAVERCGLGKVLFVPAGIPPHKRSHELTSFIHRYAMVALALQDEKNFVPSLLEAPDVFASSAPTGTGEETAKSTVRRKAATEKPKPNYSIDTVRELKQTLKKADRLFFLIGIDAFKDIGKWHESRALLAECEFIVASRPGYSLRDVAESLPEGLRPPESVTKPFQKQPATGDLVLPGLSLHLLEGVRQDVSATTIRAAAAQGKPLTKWLDPRVAEYVKKVGLYRSQKAS